MRRTILSGVVLLTLLALLLPPRAAAQAVDWSSVAGEQEVVVVTRNADGTPKETTIWLAVLDGRGYIRTGNTRWWANVERDPNVVLQIAGKDHPLRAELVTDPALQERVESQFRAKYGFSDRLAGLMHVISGTSHVMHLAPRTSP